jgi:hypothetical protein
MAKRKKSRTPAPPRRPVPPRSDGDGAGATGAATDAPSTPRPIQAPKVRTGKRRTQAEQERRARIILYSVAGAGLVGVVAAVLAIFVLGKSSSTTAHFDGPAVDFPNLPGLIRSPPKWGKNTKELEPRLKKIGVQLLPAEGNVLHIHQHLDIFNEGKHVTVPALIGIRVKSNNQPEFAELHTHDTTGVIHLESARAQAFSLGQFFGTWGVYLAKNCVGGLCSPPGAFTAYVNGKQVPPTADLDKLVLQQHDEIALVYGTPPKTIPSGYAWPTGE